MSNFEYDKPEFYELVNLMGLTFSNLYADWFRNSPSGVSLSDSCLSARNPLGCLFSNYESRNNSGHYLVYLMEEEAENAKSLMDTIKERWAYLPKDSHEKTLLELIIKWLDLYRQVTVEWRTIGIQNMEGGITAKGIKSFNYGLKSISNDLKNLVEECNIQIDKEEKPQTCGDVFIPDRFQEEKLQAKKKQETEVMTNGIKKLEEICFFNETYLLPALPLEEKIKFIRSEIKDLQNQIDKNKSELSQKWQGWRERFMIVIKASLVGMVLQLFSNKLIAEIIGVSILLAALVVTLQPLAIILFSISNTSKNKILNSEICSKELIISDLYNDIQEIKNN
jgi:hypothetical protein